MGPLGILSSVVTSGVIAAAIFRRMLQGPANHIRDGCWNLTMENNPQNLLNRAKAAIHGPFQLPLKESVYFTAIVDSDGSPLATHATYRIHGTDPPARWWSVTVYRNNHLIPNELNRYSFSRTTVCRDDDKSWSIFLAPTKQGENWLPSGDHAGRLTVVLRLYNPVSRSDVAAPVLKLPQIFKVHE